MVFRTLANSIKAMLDKKKMTEKYTKSARKNKKEIYKKTEK